MNSNPKKNKKQAQNFKHHKKDISDIAELFSQQIWNLYNPAILLMDKIKKDNAFVAVNESLADILDSLKNKIQSSQLGELLSYIDIININHKKIKDIISITDFAIRKDMKMINEYLNYSDIIKDAHPININNIINSVILKNEALLDINSIKVEKKLDLKSNIIGNREQFYILIDNLVNNAVKAIKKNTPAEKSGKIYIRTYQTNSSSVMEVEDNGIGISKENIGKIFKPFFSLDKKGGFGLGLAICTRIINMYDGTINVKSTINSGTVFCINFNMEHTNG